MLAAGFCVALLAIFNTFVNLKHFAASASRFFSDLFCSTFYLFVTFIHFIHIFFTLSVFIWLWFDYFLLALWAYMEGWICVKLGGVRVMTGPCNPCQMGCSKVARLPVRDCLKTHSMNDMGSHELTFKTYLAVVVNALWLCSSDNLHWQTYGLWRMRPMTQKEMWEADLDVPVDLNVTHRTGMNHFITTWQGLFGG